LTKTRQSSGSRISIVDPSTTCTSDAFGNPSLMLPQRLVRALSSGAAVTAEAPILNTHAAHPMRFIFSSS
jgi:hypothetical protein